MNKIYIAFLSLIVFSSCTKNMNDLTTDIGNKLFEFEINISEEKGQYAFGDTLWIETEIELLANDIYSNTNLSLPNASALISCVVNKIYSTVDTLDFINSNFNILIENGGFELVNVIDDGKSSYIFDLICS